MPVRIYDIAKKLGVESKVVLTKAKELGITGAKVPSSSLDKITAAYLEEQMGGLPPAVAEPAPPVPLTLEPVVLVTAPPPPVPPPAPEAPEPTFSPSVSDVPSAPAAAESPTTGVAASAPEVSLPAEPGALVPTEPAPLLPPSPPPPPPGPRLGELVGRIQLPQRPTPKTAPAKPQPRTVPVGRGGRPGTSGFGPTSARPGIRSGERDNKVPAPAPAAPKFIPPATGEVITVKPPIIVRDLAEQIKRKPFQLIADLMELGVFATVNQAIDEPVAQRLCAKYGFRFELEKRERGGGTVHAPPKPKEVDVEDKAADLAVRAPVITIMGHVDHGKTSLLDVIRKSNVAAKEAGGITQHIGAYTISIPHPERKKDLQQITFLDTPGHAAFSAMRARGANVTDLVVLVVAANDGVMPQTEEALNHAQAAKVPVIVAVNKCDHPNASPMKVRQQLQDRGLVCEEWGGNTIFVDVSALTRQGVDKLLEMLVLQADVMELKANPNRSAKGNVIESGLEPGGPMATVLVRKGTLHVGDMIICGQHYGKVRALSNEEGKRLKEAGPSVAVKVLGLNGIPEAGVEFSVVENDKDARSMAEERAEKARSLEKDRRPAVTLETLFETLASDPSKVLRVVVKADTQGSVEAIVDALKKIEAPKVSLDVLHSAVGTVTESDVILASASKAIVLGFHTRIDSGVPEVAKREGVQIKLYAIIYELIDEVKEAMAGLLEPVAKEVVVGMAEVRRIFELSKGGHVAGCVVANGRIVKGKVRVMRRKNLVFEGLILSLRRFQDEANEARAGMECGIRLDGFNDFQVGDAIESYTVEKVAQKL
jgi:translation initiation factor IF-2